jgi:hypothetical protein
MSEKIKSFGNPPKLSQDNSNPSIIDVLTSKNIAQIPWLNLIDNEKLLLSYTED